MAYQQQPGYAPQPGYGSPGYAPAPQPGYAAAGYPQPVMMVGGMGCPPGAPPGGAWVEEKYCGVISLVIGILILPCIACCPVDSRMIYVAPNGMKYLPTGAIVA